MQECSGFDWKPPYLCFLLYLNFREILFLYRLKMLGLKVCGSSTSSGGQDKVTAPWGARQGWREPGSCTSCYPEPWRILKKAEGFVLIQMQGECLSFVPGREGFAQPPMLTHTHRAALLQQSPSVKGKRGFDCLPANLVANCQCFCSSCAGLFHPAIPELAVPFQK